MKKVQTQFHDVQRPLCHCSYRYFVLLSAEMIALRFRPKISQRKLVFALKSYRKISATLQREFGQQISYLSLQSKRNNISKMRNFNKDNSQLWSKCMFEQHRVICKKPLILHYTSVASSHKSFQTEFFKFNFSWSSPVKYVNLALAIHSIKASRVCLIKRNMSAIPLLCWFS